MFAKYGTNAQTDTHPLQVLRAPRAGEPHQAVRAAPELRSGDHDVYRVELRLFRAGGSADREFERCAEGGGGFFWLERTRGLIVNL